MMWKRVAGVMLALAVLGVAEARAQVAWDSPMLMPPQPTKGLGIFVIDPSRGNVGVLGTWRGSGTLGYRMGLAEDFRGDMSVFGGIDARGTLTRANRDFPLDVGWMTGVGLGIGDNALVTFPLGLSVGRAFDADDIRFTPYLTPRVSLDASFGSGSDLSLHFAADIGIDIAFQPSWKIRFGGTFGDRSALAIGVVF